MHVGGVCGCCALCGIAVVGIRCVLGDVWRDGEQDAHAHDHAAAGQRRHAMPTGSVGNGELRAAMLFGRLRGVDVGAVVELLGDLRLGHAQSSTNGDDGGVVQRSDVSGAEPKRAVLGGDGVSSGLSAEHVVDVGHVLADVRNR